MVSVAPDSDAAKKGVQAGDVITGANGEKITTMEELNAQKEKLSAGDTISLDIYRGGQTIQVDVVLMEDVPDTADNG